MTHVTLPAPGRTADRHTSNWRLALVCVWAVLAMLVGGALPAQAQTAPESGAFSPETQAALQRIVDQHLAATGAPGVVVGVWIPSRGTWVHAQGVGDVEAGTPIAEADTFRIASITKTFVATVVLQLIDEGQLGLDDTLERYLPGTPNGSAITIRHLLGMTSGVYDFLEDPTFATAYAADPLMPFTPVEGIAIAQLHPADFPPGQGFGYSETNYFLLGLIVEQVTGLPVAEAIDQRILQPLQLTSTSFPTQPDLPEPYAHGYSATPGGALEDVTAANPDIPWTAGAMVSNLDDLHVWVRALATGELLRTNMQRERLQWTTVPGGESLNARYGLGIFSLAGFLGHNGGIPGYSSIGVYLPEADATLVVLVNKSTLHGGAADSLFFDIAGLLFPERFSIQPAEA